MSDQLRVISNDMTRAPYKDSHQPGFLPILIYTEFPLPTQLYFLISSFKYENNMEMFVCDYHVNDPTTLLLRNGSNRH